MYNKLLFSIIDKNENKGEIKDTNISLLLNSILESGYTKKQLNINKTDDNLSNLLDVISEKVKNINESQIVASFINSITKLFLYKDFQDLNYKKPEINIKIKELLKNSFNKYIEVRKEELGADIKNLEAKIENFEANIEKNSLEDEKSEKLKNIKNKTYKVNTKINKLKRFNEKKVNTEDINDSILKNLFYLNNVLDLKLEVNDIYYKVIKQLPKNPPNSKSNLEKDIIKCLECNNNIEKSTNEANDTIKPEYTLYYEYNNLHYWHDVDFYFEYKNRSHKNRYGIFLEVDGNETHYAPSTSSVNKKIKISPKTVIRNRNIEFILDKRQEKNHRKIEVFVTVLLEEFHKAIGTSAYRGANSPELTEEQIAKFNHFLSCKIDSEIDKKEAKREEIRKIREAKKREAKAKKISSNRKFTTRNPDKIIDMTNNTPIKPIKVEEINKTSDKIIDMTNNIPTKPIKLEKPNKTSSPITIEKRPINKLPIKVEKPNIKINDSNNTILTRVKPITEKSIEKEEEIFNEISNIAKYINNSNKESTSAKYSNVGYEFDELLGNNQAGVNRE